MTSSLSASTAGELVTQTLDFDGGRPVTVYVPARPPEAVVFAGDGQLVAGWGRRPRVADVPATMVVGVHRQADETLRLHEYSPPLEPERFAAHERFFVNDVRRWVWSRFGVALPPERTAVLGVSAGAELALAVGLRHPDIYGNILCASPGSGYQPPAVLPSPLPRTYLVAGTREPFFRDNARRWAAALRAAGSEAIMTERDGSHGGPFLAARVPSHAGVGLRTTATEPSEPTSDSPRWSRLKPARPADRTSRPCIFAPRCGGTSDSCVTEKEPPWARPDAFAHRQRRRSPITPQVAQVVPEVSDFDPQRRTRRSSGDQAAVAARRCSRSRDPISPTS